MKVRKIGCGKPIPWTKWASVTCGSYHGGRKVLCRKCEEVADEIFPQGWRGYPGDTCKHGVYVGGCGVDYVCGRCELEGE